MSPIARLAAALLAASLAGGCAVGSVRGIDRKPLSSEPYRPDRRDYLAFREAHPDLLEPNYLPFMVHRKAGDRAAGDLLLFCRWPDSSMPLAVFVDEAEIPEALQDEFNPIDPAAYTQAVVDALATWEKELEGLVRFRRVFDPRRAHFRMRILPEEAPGEEPEIRVLGTTGALDRACRAHGWDPDSDRLQVSYAVPEARIYAADEFGLLTGSQVQAIALHEVGHVLGMMGHSPVPTDLMFRVLGERTAVTGLGEADVNSFVSLYRLPNGTHYGEVQPDGPGPRPDPLPPTGGPELSLAPHVDAQRGFEVRTPAGWLRAPHSHGLFAANGPIWDNDVSFEIFVWPYPTVEAYLERFAPALFANTWRRFSAPAIVDGRRALQVVVEDPAGETALDFHFVELGDGRVMVILSACPVDVADRWWPWFQATLASLEIWPHSAEAQRGHGE